MVYASKILRQSSDKVIQINILTKEKILYITLPLINNLTNK